MLSNRKNPNKRPSYIAVTHQFWQVPNGLATRCDFGNQTEKLVYDIFVLNMENKQVQEKLSNGPKENTVHVL